MKSPVLSGELGRGEEKAPAAMEPGHPGPVRGGGGGLRSRIKKRPGMRLSPVPLSLVENKEPLTWGEEVPGLGRSLRRGTRSPFSSHASVPTFAGLEVLLEKFLLID